MPDNGNGRDNGRGAAPPLFDEIPYEEVRSLVWEFRKARELCECATVPRNVNGEVVVTGRTENRLVLAIDLGRILDRHAREIGRHRHDRFLDFVAGCPRYKFPRLQQVQLKDDVRRLAQLTVIAGYQSMLFKTFPMSGAGEHP